MRMGLMTVWLVALAAAGADRPERTYIHMTPELSQRVAAAIPGRQSPLAELEWEVKPGAGFVTVQVRDEGRAVAWMHVLLRQEFDAEARVDFPLTCAGYPAARVKDRWTWVLVGRIELRVNGMGVRFENDAMLDRLVLALDLEQLEKL